MSFEMNVTTNDVFFFFGIQPKTNRKRNKNKLITHSGKIVQCRFSVYCLVFAKWSNKRKPTNLKYTNYNSICCLSTLDVPFYMSVTGYIWLYECTWGWENIVQFCTLNEKPKRLSKTSTYKSFHQLLTQNDIWLCKW